jgi:hypothetical protein
MGAFMEPLGTDQASPLFSGLYRYLPYAEAEVAADMRRVMLNMLAWYEQQGFKYFYYKAFIHSYAPHALNSTHANSYYLPALAWAAQTCPEDLRWQRHLDQRLGYFVDGQYQIYPPGVYQPAFCWGSDMDVLHYLLGARFDEVFGPLLDGAYQRLTEVLAGYAEPGTVERLCPESAEPGFQPSVAEAPDPELDPLGFAYFRTRHQGRTRPRAERHFLMALAAIGYRTEETVPRAAELLALSQAVPADFSEFLSEDYDRLPETVHLYARSVGVNLVGWWRDYWLLRKAVQDRP